MGHKILYQRKISYMYLIYRTTSIRAHAHYLANEFFRVRTNREGVLSEGRTIQVFISWPISQIYFSRFFDKKL